MYTYIAPKSTNESQAHGSLDPRNPQPKRHLDWFGRLTLRGRWAISYSRQSTTSE